MKRIGALSLIAVGFLLPTCTDNTSPGNDREARVSSPEPAADVASVSAAIEGAGTELLVPQTLTEADLGNVPGAGTGCVFRFTRVGLPILVYGSTAVLKLNDKLVSLPLAAAGDEPAGERYAANGVTVIVRPLEEDRTDGEPFPAEFVFHLPDADHELGYHGFSECGSVEHRVSVGRKPPGRSLTRDARRAGSG